jgi:hypothetical protein
MECLNIFNILLANKTKERFKTQKNFMPHRQRQQEENKI